MTTTDARGAAEPPEPPEPPEPASPVTTYRYLRAAIVGTVLLLGVSVALEAIGGESGRLGSISAYYYTPVRSVFVGVLVSVGLCLVAIKGRDGAENTLLDLAGLLAPVVACVPTPIERRLPGGGFERHVPDAAVPGIDNNVVALLVLAVAGLVFAAWVSGRDGAGRSARVGLGVAVAVVAGFALWFAVGHDSFVVGAHYAAAVPLFLLITVVAWINAVRTPGRRRTWCYRGIAAAMALALVVAAVLFVLQSTVAPGLDGWVFWVETVLLALFSVFWVLQTAEYWREGPPSALPAG